MNPRVTKEFRPLLLPWIVAALAAAGHLVAFADPVFAKGEFGSFLVGFAGVAFVTGVLVLSALPLGFELHDHTLMLLLSQPAHRVRLWEEKLRAAALSVLALALVHGVASAATGHLSRPEAILYAAFVVTAICSVGYHTLAARSVLVGIASAAATPFAVALAIHSFVYYVLGLQVEPSEGETVALVVIGCAAYSAFSLWFGRRQFTTLELKDAGVPRGAQIPQRLVPRKLTELFRSKPTGAVANLIRKEVCLQKPIFLVSAIFTVCWLLTLALMILHPAWHSNCVAVLHGLTGTQVVLMVILTGCVSLGDDKALGTAAWHLTLPVSGRRQWLVKLSVSAATAVAMAVILPLLLAGITLFKAPVGLLALGSDQALGFVVPCALVFVLSFWSASVVSTTVRAALTTVAVMAGLAVFASLGGWLSARHFAYGLQSNLIFRLRDRLWPEFPANHEAVIPYSIGLVVLTLILAALIQSLKQFRRTQAQPAAAIKSFLILAVFAFVGSFWLADLMRSLRSYM